MNTSEWAPAFPAWFPTTTLAPESSNRNLFSIVMLVKRNRLVGCQGLGKHKEIFGFPELTINLNCKGTFREDLRGVPSDHPPLLAGLSEQGTRVLFPPSQFPGDRPCALDLS